MLPHKIHDIASYVTIYYKIVAAISTPSHFLCSIASFAMESSPLLLPFLFLRRFYNGQAYGSYV